MVSFWPSQEVRVPRFGMRKFPSALATLAAIVLAVAGCLTAAAAVVPARAATDFSLVILPDQGENAIDNFVNSATSSINVTIYELNDTTLVNDLVAREKAGVAVRVILDQAQKSYNTAAYNALTAGGVGVVWSSATFTYTHQKTITVNNDESYISTGNFDTAYYATSRDYGVFDTDASDVAAIVAVFNADYAHTSITPSDGDDLVWSPTDSQTRLLALINGATKSLDIEQEEFSDTAIINALVAAEKRGVTVRVVLEDPSSYSSEVSEVEAAGGQVTGYSSSTGFYIHAKTIIADYGTSAQKAFAGSENFSSNSLNDNRELGLITTDTGVVDGLESTFAGDFSGSAAGKVSIIGPGSLTSPVGSVVDYQVQADDTCTGSLSYAASGLPKGLSISSSTGVISGTPTTAGSAAVTVTATDTTGASGSTSFAFTISAAAGGCGAQQLLVNGGFETGSISPWTASSGVLASNTSAHPSQAGSYLAWLDGYSKTHVDTLSQKVAIPATCVSANFTYWVEVNSTGTTTTEQPENTLVLQILNSSGTVESTTTVATAANSGSSYVEHSASLGSYIGQTITLKFTATEVAGGNTQFLDDSNALTVS
jgi:hypothetical protein